MNKKQVIIVGIIISLATLVGVIIFLIVSSPNKESVTSRSNINNIDTSAANPLTIKGEVWTVVNKEESNTDSVSVDVYANTAGENLGLFEFKVKYDTNKILIDYSKGVDGISNGVDTKEYMIIATPEEVALMGTYEFSGMAVKEDAGSTSDKHIATIYLKLKEITTDDISTIFEIKEVSLANSNTAELITSIRK